MAAQGEAEHGCAQGGSCLPGQQEQPLGGKLPRRFCAGYDLGGWPECDGEGLSVPRQRIDEGPPESDLEADCCINVGGWVFVHQHGPVRPGSRRRRRERPPQRWC